jgi:hypothetical protein
MTTDAVDELLCEAEAKFDRTIVELAVGRAIGCWLPERRHTTCHG